jgi:hypothetical protein
MVPLLSKFCKAQKKGGGERLELCRTHEKMGDWGRGGGIVKVNNNNRGEGVGGGITNALNNKIQKGVNAIMHFKMNIGAFLKCGCELLPSLKA